MKRMFFIIVCLLAISFLDLKTQVLIDDFPVNDVENNSQGVWRPRIAAAPDGSFSVLWQDYNDRPGVHSNTNARSHIAVQRYSESGQPLEGMHFFRPESEPPAIWLFDYLENAEANYLSDGTLVLLFQHSGRLSIGGDDIGSAEATISAINSDGEKIKLSDFGENVQFPIIFSSSRHQDNPRFDIAPDDAIAVIVDEASYNSDFRNIALRTFDVLLDVLVEREIPHDDGVGIAPHVFADVAAGGSHNAVVWQDGRYSGMWSVSVQFYSGNERLGDNYRVNDTVPGTAAALVPSIAMNDAGQSVVVWADTRSGPQIFGQLFDAAGNPVGENFQISATAAGGDIYSRPEVAMRNDGSFMVVWTDSTAVDAAFRAQGREFDMHGNPVDGPVEISGHEGISGYPDIDTDGTSYYLSWLDDRQEPGFLNVYAKKINTIATSVAERESQLPQAFKLFQNYPNPFNPSTVIGYDLPVSGDVLLAVYDMLGRRITTLVNEHKEAGRHTLTFNAGTLPNGVYIYRITSGEFTDVRRMMIVK